MRPLRLCLIVLTVPLMAAWAFAEDAPAAPEGPPPPAWLQFLGGPGLLVILLLLLFWVMLSGKRRQDREREKLISSIKKHDRVQTIGGIIGTVMDIRDDRVILKVDETNNTRIAFAKAAVHRVLGDENKADNTGK